MVSAQPSPPAPWSSTRRERALEARLEEHAARHRAVLDALREALLVFDHEGRVVDANPALEVLLERPRAQLVGSALTDWLGVDQGGAVLSALQRLLEDGHYDGPSALGMRTARGRALTVALSPSRFRMDGVWQGCLTLRDAMAEEALCALLEHGATHDHLTGLPNRAALVTQLEGRSEAESAGLIFCGLDDLGSLNEARGYQVGDVVLLETAQRLGRLVSGDGLVYRLWGDEFAVLTERHVDPGHLWRLAEQIEDALRRPYRTSTGAFHLTASLGLTCQRQGACTPASLLREAGTALTRAKHRGPGSIEAFAPEMRAQVEARHGLETALKGAALTEELLLHYQPVMRVSPCEVVGFEALLRWRREDGTMIPPNRFIPALERSGQIQQVGAWVLQTACEQLLEFDAHAGGRDLHMAVNLSVRQLAHADVVDMVQATLQRTGVDPARIVLEVTESVLALDLVGLTERLAALRALGVSVSIDDFGTGYSSLAYLHRLPADTLKVDRAFVADLGEAGGDAAIVRTIAALARSLGLQVVAEGVEGTEQLDRLEALGVDFVQGFFFAPGLEASRVIEALEGAQNPWVSRRPSC